MRKNGVFDEVFRYDEGYRSSLARRGSVQMALLARYCSAKTGLSKDGP